MRFYRSLWPNRGGGGHRELLHWFRLAGVFFDMENPNKLTVRSDTRGRRKSLPGCVCVLFLRITLLHV